MRSQQSTGRYGLFVLADPQFGSAGTTPRSLPWVDRAVADGSTLVIDFALVLPSGVTALMISGTTDAALRSLITPTISSGTNIGAVIREARDTPGELWDRAQLALRHARRVRPGSAALHPGRFSDLAHVSEAISHGEFHVAFQPIVELRTRRVVGAEALLRWADPSRGTLTPADYIPFMESSGAIVPIGYWVLERSVEAAVAWSAIPSSKPLHVSVNVSGVQLWQPDFAVKVIEICSAVDFPLARLRLEIIETQYENGDAPQNNLAALRAAGVMVALDDFGTGYSNLGRLNRLGADLMKIDRSFVANMADHASASPIVTTIVSLAEMTSMTPIAEGIETEEQARRMLEARVDLGQGFLYSKAVRASEFVAACAFVENTDGPGHLVGEVA